MINIDPEILKLYFFLQKEISIIFDPIEFKNENNKNHKYIVPYGTPIPKNMHEIFPNITSPNKGLDVYIHIGLFETLQDVPKDFYEAYYIIWQDKIAIINIEIIDTQDDLYLIQEMNQYINNIIEDFTDTLLPAPKLNTNFSLKEKERNQWQLKLQELKKIKDLFGPKII